MAIMNDRATVIATLKRVRDTETGVDIVTERLVYGYTANELVTEIWMSFTSNTPVCFFCKAIAWTLIEKIFNRIVEELQEEGYKNVRVVDALNPRIYYRSM
jgi:metal-sulfur cluster biosynthetic enzyme